MSANEHLISSLKQCIHASHRLLETLHNLPDDTNVYTSWEQQQYYGALYMYMRMLQYVAGAKEAADVTAECESSYVHKFTDKEGN